MESFIGYLASGIGDLIGPPAREGPEKRGFAGFLCGAQTHRGGIHRKRGIFVLD